MTSYATSNKTKCPLISVVFKACLNLYSVRYIVIQTGVHVCVYASVFIYTCSYTYLCQMLELLQGRAPLAATTVIALTTARTVRWELTRTKPVLLSVSPVQVGRLRNTLRQRQKTTVSVSLAL